MSRFRCDQSWHRRVSASPKNLPCVTHCSSEARTLERMTTANVHGSQSGSLHDTDVPRRVVWSWALWDWATQPFNSVITTFVFSVFITSSLFLPPEIAAKPDTDPGKIAGLADLSAGLGLAVGLAGVLIAVLAPVIGQRADVAGRRKLWLALMTGALALSMALLFFVTTEAQYFWLGAGLIAAGAVFSEIAAVNYNAMLLQVSTPKNIGRISGLGWGIGYLGGIVMLTLVIVAQKSEWFGIPQTDGLNIRLVAVFCAVWSIGFALPLFINVPEAPPALDRHRVSFWQSYVEIGRTVRKIWQESRPLFWFLVASAIYRDGLAGVFTFGAVIASVTFRFSFADVVLFGVAANVVAGITTILTGRLDDRIGPRRVILTALTVICAVAVVLFFVHDGQLVFWIFGLVLSAMVGPAQSASRSLLARITPVGREGEMFGVYATTGRAASFIAPLLWSAFIAWFGAQYWGILGIGLVVAVGLVMMLWVRPARDRTQQVKSTPGGE
ncbi:MAG: MFS transporter [Candidatus Lumbricidophila eiseniae]|uniref:MFS transporter n=1 Tax=Candidatus Lumbricidiphila eiseniae TaxID=1969409 RepID=A0A2A6FTT6_9MICO|nr:MAG: MFS transporter [Candidatus Lumbricidophila eiseniae]